MIYYVEPSKLPTIIFITNSSGQCAPRFHADVLGIRAILLCWRPELSAYDELPVGQIIPPFGYSNFVRLAAKLPHLEKIIFAFRNLSSMQQALPDLHDEVQGLRAKLLFATLDRSHSFYIGTRVWQERSIEALNATGL